MTHTSGKYFFLSRPRRFGSGTPTYLLNMMRKYDFTPIDLGEQMDASKDDFDAATETMTTIMPLFYQSGYITIFYLCTWKQV